MRNVKVINKSHYGKNKHHTLNDITLNDQVRPMVWITTDNLNYCNDYVDEIVRDRKDLQLIFLEISLNK